MVLTKTSSHKLNNFLSGALLSFHILRPQGVVSYLGMAKKPVHDDRCTPPTDRLASTGFNPFRHTIRCAVIKDSSIIDFCVGNRVYGVVTGMYSRTVYRVYENKDCAVMRKKCVYRCTVHFVETFN